MARLPGILSFLDKSKETQTVCLRVDKRATPFRKGDKLQKSQSQKVDRAIEIENGSNNASSLQ